MSARAAARHFQAAQLLGVEPRHDIEGDLGRQILEVSKRGGFRQRADGRRPRRRRHGRGGLGGRGHGRGSLGRGSRGGGGRRLRRDRGRVGRLGGGIRQIHRRRRRRARTGPGWAAEPLAPALDARRVLAVGVGVALALDERLALGFRFAPRDVQAASMGFVDSRSAPSASAASPPSPCLRRWPRRRRRESYGRDRAVGRPRRVVLSFGVGLVVVGACGTASTTRGTLRR